MTSPTQQTVLVTGGAGFIGAHLVERLVRAGDRVVSLDLLTDSGNLHNRNWGAVPPGSTLVRFRRSLMPPILSRRTSSLPNSEYVDSLRDLAKKNRY